MAPEEMKLIESGNECIKQIIKFQADLWWGCVALFIDELKYAQTKN